MRPPLLFVGPYMGNRPGRTTTAGRILADLLMADGYPVRVAPAGLSRIARFAKLAPGDRFRLGRASLARAEAPFHASVVADHYLRVLEAAAGRKPLKIEHWPPVIPAEDHE